MWHLPRIHDKQKRPTCVGLFCLLPWWVLLGADGADRARINTGAAVDAGVSVDNPLATLLADSVDRTGIFASCTVGAIVGNLVSQVIHLLCCKFNP